jgi:hypothetical protein
VSQYPPGPPANYPPGGPPGGPPPAQPGWGQQPPPGPSQPGWGQQPPPQQPGWGPPGQPGQPGPPGYAGGPPAQPGSGGGGGGGAKILLGVAVVAVVAVGAFFLLSGDDSAGASPTDAVETFFDAIQDGDCSRAMDVITEATWSENGSLSREEALASCEEEMGQDGGLGALGGDIESVELVSEEGDNATVQVTGTGELGSFTVPVVKESGSWKVDMLNADFGGGSSSDGGGDGGDGGDGDVGDLPSDVTIPEDLDIPDISLPEDLEDFDPSQVDCSILEDPELIEQCEAGLEAGFGGG